MLFPTTRATRSKLIVAPWYNFFYTFHVEHLFFFKYLTSISPQKWTCYILGISIMLVVLFSFTFLGLNCKTCLSEARETYRLSYQWDWRTEKGRNQQKWGRKSFLNYQSVFGFLGWQWEAVNLLGYSALLKMFIIFLFWFLWRNNFKDVNKVYFYCKACEIFTEFLLYEFLKKWNVEIQLDFILDNVILKSCYSQKDFYLVMKNT